MFCLQIHDLYEEFHITELPLLEHEVRGREQLESFSRHLIDPYTPSATTSICTGK
jgi:arsenite-transporting ATPase